MIGFSRILSIRVGVGVSEGAMTSLGGEILVRVGKVSEAAAAGGVEGSDGRGEIGGVVGSDDFGDGGRGE